MSQHISIPTTCLILSDIDLSEDDHDDVDVDDTTVLLHNYIDYDRSKSQSTDDNTTTIVFSRSKNLCSSLFKTLLVSDVDDDMKDNSELDDYYRSICKNDNSTLTISRSQYNNNKELHSLLASTMISNDYDNHLEYGGEKKCHDLPFTTYSDRVMDDDDDVLSPHNNMNSNNHMNNNNNSLKTTEPVVANATARSATYDDDNNNNDNNDDVQYKNRYSSSTIDTVVLRLDEVDSEYSGRTTLSPYLSSPSFSPSSSTSSSSCSRRVHHDGDDYNVTRKNHIGHRNGSVPNRSSKMTSQISSSSKISRGEENKKKRPVWRNTSPTTHSSIQQLVNYRSRPQASPTLRALSPRDHQQGEKIGSLPNYDRLPNKLCHESLPTVLQTKDIDNVVISSPLLSVTSSLTTQSPKRIGTNKHLNRNNQHIHTNNTSIHPNIKCNQVTEEMGIKPGTNKLSRNKSSFVINNTLKDSQPLSTPFIKQKVTNHQFISKSRKDHQQLSKELMNNDVTTLRKSRSTSPVKLNSSDNKYISVLKEKFLKSTNVQYHHHHHHRDIHHHQQQHQQQRDEKRRSRIVPSMNRHVNISSSNYPQQPLTYIKNNVKLDGDESYKQSVSLISSNNRNGCYLLGAKSNRATTIKSAATTGNSSRSSLKK